MRESELVSLFKEFVDRKEEKEEKKLPKLQEMHNEKMSFFGQFLKVHLTSKTFFTKIVNLILWSKLTQKFLDLVKSLSFYAPSKLSFEWFTAAHRESGERQSCDVKSRTNASPVPVRSSILHECRSDFAAQVFLLGLHSQQISVFSNNVFYFVGFQNVF